MLRGRNRYSVVLLLPLFFQTAEDPFGTVVILKYALKPIRGKLRILFNLRHGDYQKRVVLRFCFFCQFHPIIVIIIAVKIQQNS